jgi:hypothetical protein
MKNIIKIFVASLFLLSACKEEIPTGLNLTPERSVFDTTYITNTIPAPQPANVYIEDFTGVKCPNCPRAQATAKNIANANPNRVVVMAIHPGPNILNFFVSPFKTPGDDHDSKYDFRSKEGGDIFNILGSSSSLPIGAINRIKFSGENVLIDDTKWNNYTNSILASNSKVNIDTFGTKGVYFVEANKIRINTKVTFTTNIIDSQYVSIAIIENGLIDFQKSGGKVIEDYEHEHVLRRMITPSTGSQLKAQIIAGRVFEKTFDYEIAIEEKWNTKNLKVIIFVHNGPGGTEPYKVLQVKEYKINE